MTPSAWARALAALLCAVAPAPLAAQPSGELRLTVTGLRSTAGMVRCALFDNAREFPRGREIADAVVPIAAGQAVCLFRGVRPGQYAIAFMHDENGNGRMDFNLLGIPTEGYGFSNNARAVLGPPGFAEASFGHDGRASQLSATIRY
jgi:uncharacterized protein (DUF2141 family)